MLPCEGVSERQWERCTSLHMDPGTACLEPSPLWVRGVGSVGPLSGSLPFPDTPLWTASSTAVLPPLTPVLTLRLAEATVPGLLPGGLRIHGQSTLRSFPLAKALGSQCTSEPSLPPDLRLLKKSAVYFCKRFSGHPNAGKTNAPDQRCGRRGVLEPFGEPPSPVLPAFSPLTDPLPLRGACAEWSGAAP